MDGEPVLKIQNLRKYFPAGGKAFFSRQPAGWVKAVDDVSFTIGPGETVGLVGESGCGKTTTSKLILRLEDPTGGSIHFMGQDVANLEGKDLLAYRRAVQAVFQDPFSSLSPRMRVLDIIGEPLEIHTNKTKAEIRQRVGEVLELVGMRTDVMRLFPHEFSGGQRQRIAIARALLVDRCLLILDDSTSAVDAATEAAIQDALDALMRSSQRTAFVIAHRISTVRDADLIVVLDQGRVAALGTHEELRLTSRLYNEILGSQLVETGRRGDGKTGSAMDGRVDGRLPTGVATGRDGA